jgi:predicted Zn-dependent protease with MMP-like domain
MDDEAFQILVDEAISTIPEEFVSKLENVSVVIADFPSKHQLEKVRTKQNVGTLLGLYEGIPQTKRGRYGVGMTLPDKITIFKVPILSIARDPNHLKEIVRNVVIHEIAHHFGMDERSVRDAEKAKSLKTN